MTLPPPKSPSPATGPLESFFKLLDEGREEEALRLAQQAVEANPSSAETDHALGLARARMGETDEALEAFETAVSLDRGLAGAYLDKAEILIDEGRFAEALETLERATPALSTPQNQAEAHYLAACALFLDQPEKAEKRLRKALLLAEKPVYHDLGAYLHLEKGEFAEALEEANLALSLDPELVESHCARGLALTHLGRIKEADEAFARAARLDPDNHFLPFRLSREEFDGAVEEALASLPDPFRRHLRNVEVAVEDVPDRDLVREGLGYDLLGLYQGGTIRSGGWGFPDRILVFQRNLENTSPDRQTLIREIRDTVLHEVGHHLGMEEEHLQEIEEESAED